MKENPKQFNDKQRHILKVSEKLFATNGFAGTSVRDIAQEAGINIAMISYYFGSKEKLLHAIFEMRTSYIKEGVKDLMQNDSLSPLQKVFLLLESYVERMMDHQAFHKIMVREQIAQADPEICAMIHETKRQNQEFIKKLIEEGQKKGDFKKNIDVPLMMVTMIGTANQLISTQHYYKEINHLQDMSSEDFQKLLRKKLTTHLKTLFKAILTYGQ